jgi:hypothetical protein
MVSVLDWLGRASNALAGFLSIVSQAANSGDWSTVVNTITTWAQNLSTIIGGKLANLFSPENVAWALTEGRARLVSWIIDKLGGILTEAINNISENMPAIIQGASQYVKDLIPNLITGIENSWTILSNSISFQSAGITNALSNMWDALLVETDMKGKSLSDIMSGVLPAVTNMWNMYSPQIGDALSGVWESIKQAFNRVWDWLMENYGSKEAFSKVIQGMIDNFGEMQSTAVNELFNMLGVASRWIVSFLSGPEVNSAFEDVKDAMSRFGENIGFILGAAITDFYKMAMREMPKIMWATLKWIVDNVPSLAAELLKVAMSIIDVLNETIMGIIKGLILGVVSALGREDWIPSITKFFDDLSRNYRATSKMITDSLDEFARWWNSFSLADMFSNFIRFVGGLVSTVLPEAIEVLSHLPGILVDQVGVSIKRALTDMLTVIQNSLTAMTDSLPGGGLVSDWIRSKFGNMRDAINNVGGSTYDAQERIHMFTEAIGHLNAQYNQLIYNTQTASRSVSGHAADAIVDNTKKIATAANTLDNASVSGLADSMSATTRELQTNMSDMSYTMQSMALQSFTPVGDRVAVGVMTGFSDALPQMRTVFEQMNSQMYDVAEQMMYDVVPHFQMVGNAIADAIGRGFSSSWASVSASINAAVSSTAMYSGGMAAPMSVAGTTSVTNYNNRSVDMNVTINQTTPTSTFDNLRYAQALAQAKIF